MGYPWAPAPSDVALYVPQRVEDASGAFSADTVPSEDTVARLIENVCEDVYAATGTVPDNLINAARHVVGLGVAVRIESDYTSNEAEERSPRLAELADTYERALKRLTGAVQETPGETVPDPEYGFPDLSSTAETPSGSFTGGASWGMNF